MSGQKHAACSDEVSLAKKPRVLVKMVQKWVTESDREMSMFAWLQYEKADRDYVATLKVLYVHSVQTRSCETCATTILHL